MSWQATGTVEVFKHHGFAIALNIYFVLAIKASVTLACSNRSVGAAGARKDSETFLGSHDRQRSSASGFGFKLQKTAGHRSAVHLHIVQQVEEREAIEHRDNQKQQVHGGRTSGIGCTLLVVRGRSMSTPEKKRYEDIRVIKQAKG